MNTEWDDSIPEKEFEVFAERNVAGIHSTISFFVTAEQKEQAIWAAKELLPDWQLSGIRCCNKI